MFTMVSKSTYFKRHTQLTICAAYITLAAIIFILSFSLIQNKTVNSTKEKMEQTLTNISSKINLVMSKDAIYTRSLSTSDSISSPMSLGIYYQVGDSCNKLIKEKLYEGLVLTNSRGEIIYDNQSLFNSKSTFMIKQKEYNYFFFKNKFLILSYFPLTYEKTFCGSISSVYSIENFSDIIGSDLNATPFTFMAVYKGQVSTSIIKKNTNEKMKYTFFSELTNSKASMISDVISEKAATYTKTGFALGLPLSSYNSILLKSVVAAIFYTLLLILLLTLIVLTVYNVLKRYFNTQLRIKAEIESLRIQKHDFLKHVNIVNALADNNETEELGKYVSSLNNEVLEKNKSTAI